MIKGMNLMGSIDKRGKGVVSSATLFANITGRPSRGTQYKKKNKLIYLKKSSVIKS